MKSKLPLSPQVAALDLVNGLAECVLYKERLRLENNGFAAMVKADTVPLVEFRKYQDEEFDPRIDAVLDERHRIELELIRARI